MESIIYNTQSCSRGAGLTPVVMFTAPLGINYLNWCISGAYIEDHFVSFVAVLRLTREKWLSQLSVSYKREKLDIQFFYFRNASTRQIVYIYKLSIDKME